MNLTLAALAIALLGAPIAVFERLALPETMWLTVWGVGLLVGAAFTKNLSRAPVNEPVVEEPHDLIIKAA